jgi:hypothetical protein
MALRGIFDHARSTNYMSDVLAFDWGIDIVGVLDVNADSYRAYRTRSERIEGARRIVECAGIIISFNGDGCDLVELSKILGLSSRADLTLKGTHHDMMPIVSAIRWPPDPGTAPITGPNLLETYQHYFGAVFPVPSSHLTDQYEISNWYDCKMTAELWNRWQRAELGQ